MNVSVIIPVYNAEKFLRRAVESALEHDEVKEVVLIEDGSLDNSLAICHSLSDDIERVVLYRHPNGENRGAGATRNLGLDMATQEYISFLDADDFFTEARFEKEREIFSTYQKCDGVYGAIGTIYADETGAQVWEARGFDEQTLTTVNKRINPERLFEYLIGYKNHDSYTGYYSIIGFTVKRERLIENGIRFDASLRLHQDSFFLETCAYKLRIYTGEFENPVAIRSVHKNNRYIQSKNLDHSRYLLYQAMFDWAIAEDIPVEYKTQICQKYFQYMLARCNRFNAGLAYLNELMINKAFRKYTNRGQFNRVLHKVIFGK